MTDQSGTPASKAAEKQVYRVVIEAPIDKVWDTLTKEGEVLPFFFGSVLHTTGLRPGTPIRMRTANGKYTAVVGEVLEIKPPHLYVHTMQFTQFDDPHSKVTYELKEVEGGTEFTLTTEDVPAGTKSEKYMKTGGDFITKALKVYVETGKPNAMAHFIMLMGKLTGWTTPKRCLSENWPLKKMTND